MTVIVPFCNLYTLKTEIKYIQTLHFSVFVYIFTQIGWWRGTASHCTARPSGWWRGTATHCAASLALLSKCKQKMFLRTFIFQERYNDNL